ncbi:MAG TPA: hypothetical protein VK907_04665 [Phnomibacter sp.]|nr:hypothetical protein [Phnomibacter sp.]
MKKIPFLLLLLSGSIACQQPTETSEKKQTVLTDPKLVERGRYLVEIMACNDCHSPKIMTPEGIALDPERLLSGHPAEMPVAPYDAATAQDWLLMNMNGTAMKGPWGISFSANLTPESTGIKFWTEEQFFRSIRHGYAKGIEGNRKLLPPMPWEMYRNATDEDLSAIFAYLKSLKPVKNAVPQPIPPAI